jgi:hypothetical protein
MTRKLKKRLLSGLQLLAAIAILPLWLTCGASFDFEPIATLTTELREEFPPPPWANYYLVGGGKVTYWKRSPLEQPVRLALHIGTLAGCVLFVIGSGLYFEKLKKEDEINSNHQSN